MGRIEDALCLLPSFIQDLQAILSAVQSGRYCVVLGPRYCYKSLLLTKAKARIDTGGQSLTFVIDCVSVAQSTPQAFFQFLQASIRPILQEMPVYIGGDISSASFSNYLVQFTRTEKKDIVLFFDHVEKLPIDLIQELLKSLRAVAMIQNNAGAKVIVVLSAALGLADITLGKTSPFRGIAERVLVEALPEEEHRPLIDFLLAPDNITITDRAFTELVKNTNGTPHLIHWILSKITEKSSNLSKSESGASRISRTMVKATTDEFLKTFAHKYPPLREATRLVETDADLLECIILLLQEEVVPRRKLPLPLSSDLDPLYLTGLISKDQNENYRFRNQIYQAFCESHFNSQRVSHLFMAAARWSSAIAYLYQAFQQGETGARDYLLSASINSIWTSAEFGGAIDYFAQGLELGLGINHVEVFIYSEEAQALEPVALRGNGRQGADRGSVASIALDSNSIVARAYRSRSPITGSGKVFQYTIPLQMLNNQPFGVVYMLLSKEQYNPVDFDHSNEIVAYVRQACRAINQVRENQKRKDEERKLKVREETLRQVSKLINEVRDTDEILQIILRQMARVLEFDKASIQLADEEGNLKIVAEVGFSDPSGLKTIKFPLNDNKYPNVQVWHSRRAQSYPDISLVFDHFTDPQYQVDDIRGWLGVPLTIQGEVIGVITLDSRNPNCYSTAHEQLAEAFAAEAAQGIQNANLYRQSVENARRASELIALSEVAQEISRLLSHEDSDIEILGLVPRAVCESMNADCAILFPFSENRGLDRAHTASYGLLQPQALLRPSKKMREDEYYLVKEVLSKSELLINDIEEATPEGKTYAEYDFIKREEIRSFAGILLHTGNPSEALGVLFINFRELQSEKFTYYQISALRRFANLASFSLLNAHLYRTAREKAEKQFKLIQQEENALKTILKIKKRLSAVIDEQEMVREFIKGVVEGFKEQNRNIQVAFYDYDQVLDQLSLNSASLYTPTIQDQNILALLNQRKLTEPTLVTYVAQMALRYGRLHKILTPDVRKQPKYRKLIEETKSEFDIALMAGSKSLIGVLSLESPAPNDFKDSYSQRVLIETAEHVATAIAVARTRRQFDKLLALGMYGHVSGILHSIVQPLAAISARLLTLRQIFSQFYGEQDIMGVSSRIEDIEARLNEVKTEIGEHFRLFQPSSLADGETNDNRTFNDLVAKLEKKHFTAIRSRVNFVKPKQTIEGRLRSSIVLELVLEVFISNSIRQVISPQQPGEICLEISESSDNVIEISVQDTGGGVPDSLRDQLLIRPFIDEKSSGKGVGLYWANVVIEQVYEGRIDWKNTENGARFSILVQRRRLFKNDGE